MATTEQITEFRVCWNASTNASFSGSTEWEPEFGEASEVEDDLNAISGGGAMCIPDGLEMALDASGFEWWIETRPVSP